MAPSQSLHGAVIVDGTHTHSFVSVVLFTLAQRLVHAESFDDHLTNELVTSVQEIIPPTVAVACEP